MNKYAKSFYDYVESVDGYKCLSEYKSSDEKVLMYHSECGKTYWQTPSKFKNKGRRCHYCSKSRPLTTSILQERLDTKFPGKFTLLEEYVNSTTKIKVKNNNCGHEYSIKQQDLLSGKDCYECYGSKRYSQEEFEDVFYDKGLEGYSVVGEYNGYHNPILIKHNGCGAVFNIVPSRYFNQFKKCPNCHIKSLGEFLVEKYLIKNNISFIREYRFDDCRNKKPLPFDFYLPEYNILIEYQGEQHYKPISEFGGKENFVYTQKNDKIKEQYAINNGIRLIKIPYWEKTNIESFLVEKIC